MEQSKQIVLLALDPGITTGWALMRWSGEVIDAGHCLSGKLADTIDSLVARGVTHVVLEELPTPTLSIMNRECLYVKGTLLNRFPEGKWFRATDWKSTPYARSKVPQEINGVKLSKHAKDAMRLGRWYLGARFH